MSNIDELDKYSYGISHIEELDKYKKMYWSLHRDTKSDCQFYKNKLLEYERRINIYEQTMYYGQIIHLNHNTHGLIQNDKYNNIFFHKSNCINFILDASCIYLDVKFNVSILHNKFQAINVKLNENINKNITTNTLYDFIEQTIPTEVNSKSNTTTEIIGYDQNIDDAKNLWYMNGLGNDKSIHNYDWSYYRKNGFVTSWNQNNKNKFDIRLKIGDIIAWYLQGNGYVGILRVCGEVEILSDEDKLKQKRYNKINMSDMEYLEDDKLKETTLNYYIWKIPIEVLAYTKKKKCITKKSMNYDDEKWSSGFRGSYCIKPNNIHWNNQIIDMYKKMKKNISF